MIRLHYPNLHPEPAVTETCIYTVRDKVFRASIQRWLGMYFNRISSKKSVLFKQHSLLTLCVPFFEWRVFLSSLALTLVKSRVLRLQIAKKIHNAQHLIDLRHAVLLIKRFRAKKVQPFCFFSVTNRNRNLFEMSEKTYVNSVTMS